MNNCVYRFLDKDNETIYIGKTRDLNDRIKSHYHLPIDCYQSVCKIEYKKFNSLVEMDVAEIYYIQKFSPKYNTEHSNRGKISFLIPEIEEIDWIRLDYPEEKIAGIPKIFKIASSKALRMYEEAFDTLDKTEKRYKRIIALPLREVYESSDEVSKIYNIPWIDIVEHCEGERVLGLTHHKFNHFVHFLFYDKFEELYEKDKDYYKKQLKYHTCDVVCLTTKEVFDNAYEAECKYGIKGILECCDNKNSFYRGSLDGAPLIWMWLGDYKKMNKNEIDSYINKVYEMFYKRNKKYLLNTGVSR